MWLKEKKDSSGVSLMMQLSEIAKEVITGPYQFKFWHDDAPGKTKTFAIDFNLVLRGDSSLVKRLDDVTDLFYRSLVPAE